MATLVETPCGQTTDFSMGVQGKYETRLGDDVLSDSFARTLQQYYEKADPKDQAKCLELLSSLRAGQEIRRDNFLARRPKTAMPELGIPDKCHVTRPYETTYKREFIPRPGSDVRAIRPMTSQGMGETRHLRSTYEDEFYRKHQPPATAIRAATASGSRNHKPHPPQSFIVWKLPSRAEASQLQKPWSEELTNEKLNQVNKRLYRSTYQADYLGIPQGFQVKSAFNLPPDWKERVPYSLDSFQRATYRLPQQQEEHVVTTTRYGANRAKHLASTGIVPTSDSIAMGLRSRTTYDRHYNDCAGAVVEQIRDVNRRLEAEAVRAYLERTSKEEKIVAKVPEDYAASSSASTCSPPPSYPRPPVPTPTRARPPVPAATAVTCFTPTLPIPVHQPSPPPSSCMASATPLFLA